MSLFGPTRQCSWEGEAAGDVPQGRGSSVDWEPSPRRPPLIPAPPTLDAPGTDNAQDLRDFVADVCGREGAETAAYDALLRRTVVQQRAELAVSRGWLGAALQSPDVASALLSMAPQLGAAAAATGPEPPTELQAALDQVRQLDGMLADLTNRAATGSGAVALSGAASWNSKPAVDALLGEERRRQQHAAAVERALATGSEGRTEGPGDGGGAEEQQLPAAQEQLLERLLAEVDDGEAVNPFDLRYAGGAAAHEAHRLAEIDARLAELLGLGDSTALPHPVPTPGSAGSAQALSACDAASDCDDDYVASAACLQRVQQEAGRTARQLAQLDASLRALRTGAG